MELIHLVGVVTGPMTPCAARSSIASISLGLRATAIHCHESAGHLDFIVVNQGGQLFTAATSVWYISLDSPSSKPASLTPLDLHFAMKWFLFPHFRHSLSMAGPDSEFSRSFWSAFVK